MNKRSEEHFGEPKKEHTRIKHGLFSDTLRASLSIANIMVLHNKYKKSGSYTYIDLFAGSGKFVDDSNGSPLIAIDITANHLKQKINVFNEINLIFIEKDKQNADGLRKNIIIELKNHNLNNLKVKVGDENWEKYDIGGILKSSTWGFVFADPFSTELHLNQLRDAIEKIKEYSKYTDILIFTNFNTAKRQKVRNHTNDEGRICELLGISSETIKNDDFEAVFKSALQEKFKGIKDFALGVAIPISVGNKILKSDYFYMVLFTSSFGLVNAFLESYEKIVNAHKKGGRAENLFGLKDEYNYELEYIKNQKESSSLFEMLEYLYVDFLSFKRLIDNRGEVPTIKNVANMLNKLKEENYIKIDCEQGFIYQRKAQYGKKGDLNFNKIKSKNDLRAIKVSYIP